MTSIFKNQETKLSYKDILETFNEQVIEKPKEEVHLTYDEWIKIDNIKKNIKMKNEDIVKNNYIDDHLEQFIDLCEILKDTYSNNGFLNNIKYTDISNICIKNMIIREIIDTDSEEEESNNDIIILDE